MSPAQLLLRAIVGLIFLLAAAVAYSHRDLLPAGLYLAAAAITAAGILIQHKRGRTPRQ